jgi:hypothetical protein
LTRMRIAEQNHLQLPSPRLREEPSVYHDRQTRRRSCTHVIGYDLIRPVSKLIPGPARSASGDAI